MKETDLKSFLDEKVEKYNRPAFIETDPVQIPKQFSQKENIEIAAFLAATISWGSRPAIIKNAMRLMQLLDNRPYEFITQASANELKTHLEPFVHRTFNGQDLIYFVRSLKNIYENHGGLQQVFETGFQIESSVKSALQYFFRVFFEIPGERTRKHVANVERGASAKRLNMFLRWLVRNDNRGVDFGLWNGIPASALMLPLDVHTGNVARKLNILSRKQNDWKAVEEVTSTLRKFDAADPVKYDFALFGLGIFEKF
ncbi:TIGR02757 family protein [Mariniphaga anaerophila]|uniref:TIGR02757 family protein n=1 Tax=Mariniphaga anaerophila TaxID=1484053 RepID=A0A1M5CJ13_9BACT|nr:TIGR02757 family protein [Mariniphaga anaerophila]SHF54670.1 TIGR02757 family protein [Mariniphaga anaerophila]